MTNNNNNNNKSNQESTPLVVQHDRDVATGDLYKEGAVTLTTPTSVSSGKRAVVGLVGGLVVLMMMVLTGNTPTTPSKIYWGVSITIPCSKYAMYFSSSATKYLTTTVYVYLVLLFYPFLFTYY